MGIKVDLSLNKVLEPFNSMLLKAYCHLDYRFHRLALFLKDWNKRNFFCEDHNHLNSYSIVLMLIAYLQYVKVLPCLQTGAKEELISYPKYAFRDKQFEFAETLETNIYFEKCGR
jgi:DNA polymerase sigma